MRSAWKVRAAGCASPACSLACAFHAIDDAYHRNDGRAEFLDLFDRLQHRAAGRQHVVEHGDAHAGFQDAFDTFLGAVLLRLLAHLVDAWFVERLGGRRDDGLNQVVLHDKTSISDSLEPAPTVKCGELLSTMLMRLPPRVGRVHRAEGVWVRQGLQRAMGNADWQLEPEVSQE